MPNNFLNKIDKVPLFEPDPVLVGSRSKKICEIFLSIKFYTCTCAIVLPDFAAEPLIVQCVRIHAPLSVPLAAQHQHLGERTARHTDRPRHCARRQRVSQRVRRWQQGGREGRHVVERVGEGVGEEDGRVDFWQGGSLIEKGEIFSWFLLKVREQEWVKLFGIRLVRRMPTTNKISLTKYRTIFWEKNLYYFFRIQETKYNIKTFVDWTGTKNSNLFGKTHKQYNPY